MDIRDFKVVYISEKEANEIIQCMHFCPAYYPHYDGCGRIKLINGEIGCCPSINVRWVLRKYANKH